MDHKIAIEFKNLINDFDSKYYEKEIELLQKQILNIKMGRPRYEGIYEWSKEDIIPKDRIQKELKILEKKIEEKKKIKKEFDSALSQLKSSVQKLENLACEDFLLDKLESYVSHRNFPNIEKTEVFKENVEKYKKLYIKSMKTIEKPKFKLSKDIYKLIKENGKMKVNKFKNMVGFPDDIYVSMDNIIKDAKIELDNREAGNRIFFEFEKKYHNDLSSLGVDVESINYAIEKMKGSPTLDSLTWNAEESFNKLNEIKNFSEKIGILNGGYKILEDLEKKYQNIIEISRECWYLECVLSAFNNTAIVDSDMYRGLLNLINEEKNNLNILITKADKLYDKSGIQTKIDLGTKLQELYLKLQELTGKIYYFESKGERDSLEFYKNEYYEIRYEMINILKNHPDLNRAEYNIDLKDIKKKEMELFNSEIKKGVSINVTNEEKEIFEDKNISNSSSNTLTKELTPESSLGNNSNFYTKSNDKKSNISSSTQEQAVSLELDTVLHTYRIMYYQNYMIEKIKNSNLGKMSFSEYLESVAPHLSELIKIEKERERNAETIYKEYLKYYAAIEYKEMAMSFYDFAAKKYNIDVIDIPIQYEEEYKGMKKR